MILIKAHIFKYLYLLVEEIKKKLHYDIGVEQT